MNVVVQVGAGGSKYPRSLARSLARSLETLTYRQENDGVGKGWRNEKCIENQKREEKKEQRIKYSSPSLSRRHRYVVAIATSSPSLRRRHRYVAAIATSSPSLKRRRRRCRRRLSSSLVARPWFCWPSVVSVAC